MKKQDILAEITSKFDTVISIAKQSEVAGIAYYVANVFNVVGNAGNTINIPFFVKDEGGAGEMAYWGGGEPKPAPGPITFTQEVQAWLQSKIDVTVGSNTIRMFDQLSTDDAQQRARVRLTLEHTGTGALSTVNVALWKVARAFQYKVITA